MRTLYYDLRYAVRQLRRSPGFTFAAVLTLALAMGATTALVSVLRATLLNPTAFPRVDRLVSVQDTHRADPNFDGITNVSRIAELSELRAANGGRGFDALGFY